MEMITIIDNSIDNYKTLFSAPQEVQDLLQLYNPKYEFKPVYYSSLTAAHVHTHQIQHFPIRASSHRVIWIYLHLLNYIHMTNSSISFRGGFSPSPLTYHIYINFFPSPTLNSQSCLFLLSHMQLSGL